MFAIITLVLFVIVQSVYVYALSKTGDLITQTKPITAEASQNKFSVTGNSISSTAKTFNVAFGLSD